VKTRNYKNHLLAAITLTLTAPAVLAGQIWDGGGGNDNWDLPANWDADSLPDFNNAITFEGVTRITPFNNLTAGTVIGGINFTNDGTSGKTSAFNLSGAGITLGGNITTTASSSLIADTSALDMILNADRTVTTNTDHNLAISGIISEDVPLRALTKTGGGTLALSGDNSYTGKTSVNGGTLRVTNRTSASGAIAVGAAASGATVLNLGAGNNFTFSATTTSRIDVGGDAGATAGDSGEVNHSAGDISFISGGGNQLLVGFLGTGTYNLSGGTLTTTTSTSAGVTLGVRDGTTATFNLSGTGSLQMETGSFLQIGRFTSNSSSNNATTLFNQTGGVANIGILSIGGVNTGTNRGKGGNHTLTVTGGTFTANTFPRLAAADNNTTIINIGGTADVTLPNFPTARGTGASATLNLDGGILRNSSASGTFIAGLTNAYIQDGGATFDTSLNSATISQNLLEDPGSPGGGLTKQGANTLTLTGSNTYTGDTTVNSGVLAVTGASIDNAGKLVINGSGIVDLTNTETVAALDFDGTPQPSGDYSASSVPFGATITTARFSGLGTLSVGGAPASAYDTWSTAKGLTGLPGSSTDPAKTADPDKDGKNNLQEFAFDGNPLSGANDGKVVGKVATVSAAQVLTLTLPVRTGATFANDSGDQLSGLIDGIYYRIEGGTDLVSFAATITEVTTGDENAIQAVLPPLSTGWTYRTFRTAGTVPTVPRDFLRAKISETP
jgi:autotransporter-associated beta strand protein